MSGVEAPWELHSDDGVVRTWVQMNPLPGGFSEMNVRKEWYGAQDFLDQVAADRAAVANQRWGNGQIIGRMPHALRYASGYAQAHQQGDKKWINRFWSDPDHRNLRVKEGNL